MKAFVEFFVSRNIFVNLLSVAVLVVGGSIIAFFINREAFPHVDFDIVTVTTIYPGASPLEVERLVTQPLEESVQEVDGIEEYRSTSIDNFSSIVIQIDPDARDTRKVVDDIRSSIDRTSDLPAEIERPLVTEITSGRQPVIEVVLFANRDADGHLLIEEYELREQARILERQLLDVDGVARVVRRGWRDREIHVEIIPEMLQRLYVSSEQVVSALRNRNINFPGGRMESGRHEVSVRTVGEFDTAEEVAGVYIRSNDVGQAIRVGDVARVTETFKDAETFERVNGRESISLTVLKRENADIIRVVSDVQKTTHLYLQQAPATIRVAYINDLSFFVQRRLGVLVNNGIAGLLLVLTSLFLFLGWRTALMVGLGIPISFAITFIFMNQFGISLNLISMFGLILVIGILVDNAIVVSENFYRHVEEGRSVRDAAIEGTAQVITPVAATIVTTVAAFAPLLFMTGIMGKFIWAIPAVIIIAILASLFESICILPSHLYDVNKRSGANTSEITRSQSGGKRFHKFRDAIYRPFLRWSLNHKAITIGAFSLLFIAALVVQALFGSFKLFSGAIDAMQIRLTAEQGLIKDETQRYVEAMEYYVLQLSSEELDAVSSRIAIQQKDPNDPFARRGSNYAQLMVYLTPERDRERSARQILDDLRRKGEWMLPRELRSNPDRELSDFDIPAEYAELAGTLVSLELETLQGGPPVGKPVAIEITGDSFETLSEIAERYKEILRQIPGVIEIDDDFELGKEEIRLAINERMAAQAGVSVAQIAIAVNTIFEGSIATSIRREHEEVDVRVRFEERYRNSLDSLEQIFVMNQTGRLIPVSRMISQDRGESLSAIQRLNGERLVTVTANLDGITPLDANRTAAQLAGQLIDDYPGYRIAYSGENKDTQESFASLGRSFLVGFMIIFMILASLFRSLVQPVIVVAAIPFALVGVIFAFFIHGEPFGFLAMLGIIGLSGVVVNGSIILVDFANNMRALEPQRPVIEVIEEASSMRLRAVMLTTATTVLGLLPTAYGIGGFDPFLVPMALAFAWGLFFSATLTLILVPVFYLMVFQFKAWLKLKIEKIKTMRRREA